MDVDKDGITRVVFSVMGASEIRSRSSCEVLSAELYNNGAPVSGGLYDPRMGIVEYGHRCATCKHDNRTCPGHFGHIELASPVFNSLYIEYIKKILRCVCTKCSAVCLPEDFTCRSPGDKSLSRAGDESLKMRSCPTCGADRPERIVWDKAMYCTFTLHYRSVSEVQTLPSTEIFDIFCKIPSVDCSRMGLNPDLTRPEDLLFTAMPVTPITVRPPNKSGNQRRDDDITHKLSDIMKHNKALKSKQDANFPVEELLPYISSVQLDVMQLIENNGNGVAQARMKATNRPLKSIASRLKGKEGRVRSNLMGKRVDFSARSVITPDPNISVEELGMPIRIAMTLTFPEVVHSGNMQHLHSMVMNGPNVYPGARSLHRDGVTFSLSRAERRVQTILQIGDTVDRHIIDGDYVLFNRQPSLHRMSMMSHRVRVMPFDTFRLNVLATKPYNADFDGDEMNCHAPQSLATKVEISRLGGVKSQIISPRDHQPIIGVVQDVAVGIYLLTKDDVVVDARTAANITARCSTTMHPTSKSTVSGRDLFSGILPSTLHCDLGNTCIQSGNLTKGTVGSIEYQKSSDGILHTVFSDDGPDSAVALLDNTQSMVCSWLMHNGFSMGARDLIVSSEATTKIAKEVHEARLGVNALISDVHAGSFVNGTTSDDHAHLEQLISNALIASHNTITDIVLKESEQSNSRLLDMVKAKSKGNNKNVVQMMGILGQNLIDGRRIPCTLDNRCLPHFQRFDDSADARGFISSSFMDGLRPHEFFFHAMAGREGLIDTAVKSVTWDTPVVVIEDGYPERYLIGEWIDSYMRLFGARLQYQAVAHMESLPLQNNVFIPTTDERGNVSWGRVTVMTRHDPGLNLYEITTLSGKTVTVPESKALLAWNGSEFQEVLTTDIREGDYLPSTLSLGFPPDTIQSIVGPHPTRFPVFELTRHNGVFVGIFLTQGRLDARSNDVMRIASHNTFINHFVSSWLDQYNSSYMHQNIPNSMSGGVTRVCIEVGDVTLLNFMRRFCGPTFAERFVPPAAFASPKEFIEGILDGFFSCAGVVTQTADSGPYIHVHNHPTSRVSEGISMLCNRLSIFTTIGSDGSTIVSGVHAFKLRSYLTLLNYSDDEVLSHYSHDYRSDPQIVNDVVLDRVSSIKVIGVQDHPKLYDLTVPGTLNFGLANGLQVRDTAETGYIQRKLVKALEDLKVSSDGSVRDAGHSIVQLKYGDDGMDACSIETQEIPTFTHDLHSLALHYLVSKEDIPEFAKILTKPASDTFESSSPETWQRALQHFRTVVEDKHFAAKVLKLTDFSNAVRTGKIKHAIAMDRIITRFTLAYNPYGAMSDLVPDEILDVIDALAAEIYPEPQGKQMGAILIRAHLSPKPLIRRGCTRAALEDIVRLIRRKYYGGLVSPSEMVGIIAAQSIAEPSTQMVLNTFHNTGLGDNKASVPRIKELIGVSKNPKTTMYNIRLLPGMDKSAQFATSIRNRILCTYVKDVVTGSTMLYEKNSKFSAEDSRVDALHQVLEDDSTERPFVLRLEMDRAKMDQHGVCMMDVHDALLGGVHAEVVTSDDASKELIIRVKPDTNRTGEEDIISELRALEVGIMDIRIKGTPGIQKCITREVDITEYEPTEATYVESSVFEVVAVAGHVSSVVDFFDMMIIPGVDPINTMCDNLCHVADQLGIEGARSLLLEELQKSYSGDSYTNYRHIELLVDFMTHRGNLVAITRHGIGSTDVGPLAKCSFEQTVLKLTQAGIFGEVDNMTGVSANIMMGQTTPCGTGQSHILWDTTQCEDLPEGDVLQLNQSSRSIWNIVIDTLVQYTPFTATTEDIPHVKVTWS